MANQRELPPVINHIITANASSVSTLVFATRNQEKLQEYQRMLGVRIVGKALEVEEVQSEDPIRVLEEKAKAAWLANTRSPILVEDSVLMCAGIDGLPGPFADQFTNTAAKREGLCRMVPRANRSAVFQVGIAIFDGREVHTRIGQVTGEIAEKPRGANGFGFDDIFIPDGQLTSDGKPVKKKGRKTYAEMPDQEKERYAPRRKTLELLLEKPFLLDTQIFQLPEPYRLQVEAIAKEKLNDRQALQHAYALESLDGSIPNSDFTLAERQPYYEITYADGQIKQYVPRRDSASLGVVITPFDTTTDLYEKMGVRLKLDSSGNPVFWQMGDGATKMALAARAHEFLLHHNPQVHEYLRALKKGKVITSPRTNTHSPVIEALIKANKRLPTEEEEEAMDDGKWEVIGAAATVELGYTRTYSEEYMSRSLSADTGLILDSTGIPSSLFALGGMPPVTGHRDVIVAAALSYMRSWIPRNSIFAESFDRQLKLFDQARGQIQARGLPSDIEDIVIRQIGISVGCENPKAVARQLDQFHKAGGRAGRIYTTNPDRRVVETAEEGRQRVGGDFVLCVAPIVDVVQAKKLIDPNIRTDILLAGHGGGENCTSLEGGGVANSLELLYKLYMDPNFNKTAVGLEGGTGNAIGALLGMVDVISLNRRGVAGGIETGGLFIEDTQRHVVQPYHGSASAMTQWIEASVNPKIAKQRLTPAGKLKNVEGKPNYMRKSRYVNTVVDNFQGARMLAGRALADQGARSISELREQIGKRGYSSHRAVSAEASYIAGTHRANSV